MGWQQSHNCAVGHGTALYRFIDLNRRKVSGIVNCLQTGNRKRAKMRRQKPNILHCTNRWVYEICHEEYLVHVAYCEASFWNNSIFLCTMYCWLIMANRICRNMHKKKKWLLSDCAFYQQKFGFVYTRPFKMVLIDCNETSVSKSQTTLESEELQD